MKRLAYKYYCEGYGCGQCIIKAADEKYSLNLNTDLIRATGALGSGCGYGGLCTVLMAVIMIFGIMFDEITAKSLRIAFLEDFSGKYSSFNCCSLSAKFNCGDIIKFAADIADRLIAAELKKNHSSRL